MLVVFQLALSLLLVVSAGLFVRTLQKLRSIDAGFDRQHVLLLGLDAVATGYKDPQLADVYRRLLVEVEAVPGVRSASLSGVGLMGGRSRTCCITVPGYIPASDERMEIRTNDVTPSYFDTVGMTLREGRNFTEQDRAGKRQLVIVNEAFARRYFNAGSAVGRSFSFGQKSMMQIVGVVRDARYDGLREPAPPLVFFPLTDNLRRLSSLEVRTTSDPRAVTSLVHRAVARVEPRLSVRAATTIAQLVDSSLAREKLMALLSGFFGTLALGLACLGLYGLMAYLVARRTNEIGIRMAMGAGRRQVVGMVLREAALLVAPGAAIGLAAALASTRLVASLLFGTTPTDPVTYGLATAVLACAALVAGYLPARRAASIEPMAALRHE
jgi:predicted permease